MIFTKYFRFLKLKNLANFGISKQITYPYQFGGVDYLFDNNDDNGKKIIQSIFNSEDLTQNFKSTYIQFITALQQKDRNTLTHLLDQKLLKSMVNKNMKLINFDAEIEQKYVESKIMIGIGRDRNQYQQRMMRLTTFPQINLTLFLAATKNFNTQIIPFLLQTKIAYKSAMKLINLDERNDGKEEQKQQTHIIQYQTLGTFNPKQTDLQSQIKAYKDSIGIFNMHKSKKLLNEQVWKWLNLNKDNQLWKISDFDLFLQGNHPLF